MGIRTPGKYAKFKKFKHFREVNCNKKCHILGSISDKKEILIIYKWWRQSKQRWEYEVIEFWLFDSRLKNGAYVYDR